MFNLKQDPLLKTSIIHLLKYHLSSDQNPGCLGYARDCTSQFYKYYNKLLKGSLLTNQYFPPMSLVGFDHCSFIHHKNEPQHVPNSEFWTRWVSWLHGLRLREWLMKITSSEAHQKRYPDVFEIKKPRTPVNDLILFEVNKISLFLFGGGDGTVIALWLLQTEV